MKSPRKDYDRAVLAAEKISDIAYEAGLNPSEIKSAITLGTGLQESFPGHLTDTIAIPYGDIPMLDGDQTAAPSHKQRLVLGKLEGDDRHIVAAWQGRYHLYEGLSADACAFYVRVSKLLGVDVLGITNAAGVLNSKDIKRYDLVALNDVINNTGTSPLEGTTEQMWGEPFTPTADFLPASTRKKVQEAAMEVLRKRLPEGVYLQDRAPVRRYQTPAESRMLRLLGADLVGKSTAIEVAAAADAGIKDVFGITYATNYAQGIEPELQATVTSGHVEEAGQRIAEDFANLLVAVLRKF
jgi:purine-nucleoside phosphorylase